MISCVCLFWLLTACGGVPLTIKDQFALTEALVGVGLLPDTLTTAADVAAYRRLALFDSRPDCPLDVGAWACDNTGTVHSLNFTVPPVPAPADHYFYDPLNLFSLQSSTIRNFYGIYDTATQTLDSFELRDSIVFNAAVRQFWIFNSTVLRLHNVSMPNYVVTPVAPPVMPRTCEFTDVMFKCPVPMWIWRCFNRTSSPPCHDEAASFMPPGSERFRPCFPGQSVSCRTTCTRPDGQVCDSVYRITKKGRTDLTITAAGFGDAQALLLSTEGLSGQVTHVELFNVDTLQWQVVYDDPMPLRRVTDSVEIYTPLVRASQLRFAVELDLDKQSITSSKFVFTAWPERAEPPPVIPICDFATESRSARSQLDETLADSLCIGRVCQMACVDAPSFTFDRVVKARFLVLEGGAQWSNGTLVATPSDETRVYELDGRESNTVLVEGAGNVTRARLVGDPVTGGLPTPTLPSRLGFPGVLAKTWRRARPSGGVVVGGSNITAPANETIVSAVTVLNQTFATTVSGRLWRHSGTSWSEVTANELTAIALNRGESAAVRKVAAVGGRLVVVVAAHTSVHDGSVKPLLVNRRLVQTPVDALDVASGVWYGELLQHGIARNASDVDVVAWNATAFGVVDRTSGATAVFEWRAFAYEPQRCAVNGDCQACLTSEANEEACRWCGARCVSRQASCMADEQTIVNASLPACAGPTTTTIATTTATTTTTTASTTIGSSTTIANATTISASTVSLALSAADGDPLLALWIVLGVVAGLAVLGGVGFVVFRQLKPAAPAAAAAQPDAPVPLSTFDPNARYDAFGVDEADEARYAAHL